MGGGIGREAVKGGAVLGGTTVSTKPQDVKYNHGSGQYLGSIGCMV